MKLAVIGHPINHSKSPIIHNKWLADNRIEGTYEAIDIAVEGFATQIQGLVDAGFDGFNITIPHKQNIMALCDTVDETAQKIGAVNTVVINQGRLSGYNTDAYGFIQNIRSKHENFEFKGKCALVLGAGGAARAVLQGLVEQNIKKIYLSNRTIEKANMLKEMHPDIIEVVAWEEYEAHLGQVDILANTTSLGMVGKYPLEIDLTHLKKYALVTDIVYTPLKTPLLEQAEKQGHDIVTGLGMLLYQAQQSFEIWTGKTPDVDDDLRRDVLA